MYFFRKLFIALVIGLSPVACAYAKKAPKKPVPSDSLTAMVSVFVAENTRQGIDQLISNLSAYGADINPAEVISLIASRLAEPAAPTEYAEASQWISKYMDSRAGILSERLLSEAATEPGAVVLPSGVVFRTLEEGKGKQASPESIIIMRYTGSLPDGTIFDSIGADETPITSRVSDLAPGVADGLSNMRSGGSYILTVPAALAYGSEGVPGVIPPDTALRFEIELVEVY